MSRRFLRRLRPQLSLRIALLAFVLVSLPLAWVAHGLTVARRQQHAVAALREFPGIIRYDYQQHGGKKRPDVPKWCCRLLGDDYFASVEFVCLGGGDRFTDDQLKEVAQLRHLKELRLGGAGITDEGIARLAHLSELRVLSLAGTAITDAGVAQLQRLPRLQALWLSRSQISDAAVGALARLHRLQHLDVQRTRITPSGVERLRAALPTCEIVDSPQ